MKLTSLLLSLLLLPPISHPGDGDDWPQFRGKHRDGIARSVTQLKLWPKYGPKLIWEVDIGEGFSGISVFGDRLFTMYADGKNDFLACFELASGKEVWRVAVGEMLKNQHGNGPRSTPAVDERYAYGLGSRGRLIVVDKEIGKLRWDTSFKRDFGSEGPYHGSHHLRF